MEHGEDAWDDLLDAAGVEGAYTALGSYPDEELLALLALMPDAFGGRATDQLHWFGRRAMPLLAARYGPFFDQPDTRSFLLTLNHVIHSEVRKLYPDAEVPEFDFDGVPGIDAPPGCSLVIGYRSARRLCALAEGFVDGAAEHFGESVAIDHPHCMHAGHPRCVLVCSFAPAGHGRTRGAATAPASA